MSQSSLLKQMATLLIAKGKSTEDALELVNKSEYARVQQLTLDEDKLASITTFENLNNQLTGTKKITDAFKSSLSINEGFAHLVTELKQRQTLLRTGWNIFKEQRSMATIYLALLSLIVWMLHSYVAPQFEELYKNFGADLPALTLMYFSDAGLAVIILLLIWLIVIVYFFAMRQVKKSIETFELLPAWLYLMPVFGSLCKLVDRCISLSLYKFLTSFDSFQLPEQEKWLQQFSSSDNQKQAKWAENYFQQLKMADELGLVDDYLVEEIDVVFEQYVNKTTKSMKVLSLVITLALGLFIGSIIIAMYLPIFQLGAVV